MAASFCTEGRRDPEADCLGPALDPAVESVDETGAVDPGPMIAGKDHSGQDVIHPGFSGSAAKLFAADPDDAKALDHG
jgi:hypothetical protein